MRSKEKEMCKLHFLLLLDRKHMKKRNLKKKDLLLDTLASTKNQS